MQPDNNMIKRSLWKYAKCLSKQNNNELCHKNYNKVLSTYLLSPMMPGPAQTPDREPIIRSVLVIASWTFSDMLLKWGITFPHKSSSIASFSNTGIANMSFHEQIFFNNRTDTPNRYAATRAASGTADNTSGLHVGTYKEDKMKILSIKCFIISSFYKSNIV